jgi:hypothetical protein
MAKKLACMLGRHEWTTRLEGGESYKVCAACGKTPSDTVQSGPDQQPATHSGDEIGADTSGLEGGSGPSG